MKYYYYADNDKQFGPFTVEELQSQRLKKNILVWTEGMNEWSTADSIEELQDIVISEPPPLPISKNTPSTYKSVQITSTPSFSPIYDFDYEKEREATYVGILFLIGSIALSFVNFRENEDALIAGLFILFIFRIIFTCWVVKIASRQNRNTTGWGFFAFFSPSIALIIIGLLNKLKLKIELDGRLPPNQQSAILLKKAQKLSLSNRDSECIEILNKAIEIEKDNFECIKLRGYVNYNLKNYEESYMDFTTLFNNGMYLSETFYCLGILEMRNGNQELAVINWTKASQLGNEYAKKRLMKK